MTKTPDFLFFSKRPYLPLCLIVLALLSLPLALRPALANEPNSSFTLKIEGAMIQLKADGVPLNKILESISTQSGVKLRATDQATELIYCQVANAPLVETLKKLLRNWNFAFIYKGNGHGDSSPDSLWIINKNPRTDLTEPVYLVSSDNPEGPPLQDHQKRFEKNALSAVFAEPKKVLASFTTTNQFVLKDPVADTQSKCVQIASISQGSAIREIGLEENDLVIDVNGQPVTSAKELVEAIKTATGQDTQIIRIDRRRNDMIDPIYIETHSSSQPQ